jgi:hypothetical protein
MNYPVFIYSDIYRSIHPEQRLIFYYNLFLLYKFIRNTPEWFTRSISTNLRVSSYYRVFRAQAD